jgi:hypothetical protein
MKRLGTPHTFKTILEDIFGGCELQEAGIDYDGEPHHIQIMVANGENLDKVSYDRLNYIISKVKRASTWLDRVASTYQADMFETMLLRHNEERHDNISMDINGFVDYVLDYTHITKFKIYVGEAYYQSHLYFDDDYRDLPYDLYGDWKIIEMTGSNFRTFNKGDCEVICNNPIIEIDVGLNGGDLITMTDRTFSSGYEFELIVKWNIAYDAEE